MRTFTATTLQYNDLPWCWEIPAIASNKPVWGINIVPTPVYASYTKDENGFSTPVGDPIFYTWSALLDPADTELPSWITETTPKLVESSMPII